MRIALVSGFWGQNIGNAFFNLGGKHCLEAAGHDVRFIQDQPAYWTFRNEKRGNFRAAWSIIDKLDVDCVVLQGPVLTKNFANIWLPTIRRLAARGVRWGLLSGAFRKYTDVELDQLRQVLEVDPPLFFSSRDETTVRRVAPLFSGVRSGIDSAFFLPFGFESLGLETAPYCTLNFDHYPEPDLESDVDGPIELGGERFRAVYPRRVEALADKGKAQAYVATAFDRRSFPEAIAGLEIVRPEHRTNPHLPFKIYSRPNAIASDEPWTYLTTYANSQLTLSDRVHACVATVAYGGRAMLHNPGTRRSALFDRVGLTDITTRPVSLADGLLQIEHDAVIDYLCELEP